MPVTTSFPGDEPEIPPRPDPVSDPSAFSAWVLHGQYGRPATNPGPGRRNELATPFLLMPVPAQKVVVAEHKLWRERVRSGIVRREEMVKGISAMLKERARVKVYDHIFGWILDDPTRIHDKGGYPARRAEDQDLFL